MTPHPPRTRSHGRPGEDGFLLIGALIAVFLVLLALSVAAPIMARQLRHDKEVEAEHRGQQYVRAIQLYYAKFKHYPGSIEQLEKSNNIRFLRQKYPDPMTGKPNWRIIHLGEQKTTLKGFFGQPLAGVATSTPGVGLTPSSGIGSSSGSTPTPAGTTGSPTLGSTGTPGSATDSTASSSTTGLSSSPPGSSGLPGSSGSSGAPFVGIGSSATGDSIVVLNEQTTYPTWEFIYDPRIEQMKAKVNLLGGGMANSSSSLGSSLPSSSTPATPTTSDTPIHKALAPGRSP